MNFKLNIEKDGPKKGVATLTFDHPNPKINKLDESALNELKTQLKELSSNKEITLLVFNSFKKNVFIAGADINEIKDITTKEEAAEKAQFGQLILHDISLLPFPTLAVINGACVGGGCELALACTYRIASDHPKTLIGLPEIKLGIIPGFGGCVRMPRLIGLQNSLQLILAGKLIVAKKALRVHLIDHIYNHELYEFDVDKFITKLVGDASFGKALIKKRSAKKSKLNRFLDDTSIGNKVVFKKALENLQKKTKGKYPAPLQALETIKNIHSLTIDEALKIEIADFSKVAITKESKNLIQLFFTSEALNKETGVADKSLKAVPLANKQTAVLGAGVMGGGIAWLFSKNENSVRLKDIQWDAVSKGYQTANDYYGQMKRYRKITPMQIRNKMNYIAGCVNYNGFKNIELICEAVVENMDVKKKVLAEAESHLPEHCIITSNTSSLSVTEMGSALKRPENFIGMHFFNPVNKMPLVEIIPGEKTSQQTIVNTVSFVKSLGKTPVVVGDCAGFLVNRVLIPMLNEAALILQEGGKVTEIDAAIESFGMPMGPFILADEVGIDIGFHVASILEGAYGERMAVAGIFKHIFENEKLLGKKDGVGFYTHSSKKKEKPVFNENIDKILKTYRKDNNIKVAEFTAKVIQKRCILIMLNEAIKCLEENIVTDPRYLDMAMLMGIGFPPFEGGLLKYADNQGLKEICEQLETLSKQCGDRFKPAQLLVDKVATNSTFYQEVL